MYPKFVKLSSHEYFVLHYFFFNFWLHFVTAGTGCGLTRGGYVRNGDRCYKFHSNATDYKDAKSTCESEGAMLAEVGSLEENTFLQGKAT